MRASECGCTEIVKALVEQEGIDVNAKNIDLFLSKFISIIWCFEIIFGNYLSYSGQHLCMHL